MPSIYFDSSVSDSGAADLVGGVDVWFVSVDITTLGSRVSQIEPGLSDHFLRIGWFSLGDHFDVGFGDVDHWREINWCNFLGNLWTPDPSGITGGSNHFTLATRVRWWFSPGTVAWLRVFGG